MIRAGKDARALWHTAGPKCASVDTDGRVDPDMLDYYAALAQVDTRPATRALVRSGLWHDSRSIRSCDRCMDATDGGIPARWHYFHDWNDYQLSKAGKNDPVERKRNRRRHQLNRTEKGKDIKGRVRSRDRDLCRYCGTLTHWTNDHTSPTAGTIDHVDPFDWINSVGNCVVACRTCNGRKRDRTPAQAQMVLNPPPEPIRTGSEPAAVPGEKAGTDPVIASRDARDGPGSGRTGYGTGSGTRLETEPEPGEPDTGRGPL